MASRRIEYAGSVHDREEIDAVVAVLEAGPTALRIGRNVRELERGVAELFGKRRGIMCNSGSSALYLAVELLGLAPGDEVVHRQWGRGTVRAVSGQGERAMAEVDFPGLGRKRLLLRYAPLSRPEGSGEPQGGAPVG